MASLENVRCVVHNVTYEPLGVISGRQALLKVFKGKADVMEEHPDIVLTTDRGIMHGVPTQIRMKYMVKTKPTFRTPAFITNTNLFVRDNYTCQYCGKKKEEFRNGEYLTRDHVFPRTLGGKDEWTNIVTACIKCNNKKADTLLENTGMTLLRQPYKPTIFELSTKRQNRQRKANRR